MAYRDLTLADIDRLLAFLPRFEPPSVRHYEITSRPTLVPYEYSLDVDDFIDVLHRTCFVYPFDWSEWIRGEGERYLSPDGLASADLDALRKLMTAHIRQDRFCDGHLASILDSGHLVSILRRLRELREGMVGNRHGTAE